MNNEKVKVGIQAIMDGDYRYRCEGDDEILVLLNSLILKLESEAKTELGNTVSLSVEANETAIFSA